MFATPCKMSKTALQYIYLKKMSAEIEKDRKAKRKIDKKNTERHNDKNTEIQK